MIFRTKSFKTQKIQRKKRNSMFMHGMKILFKLTYKYITNQIV